MLVHATSLLYLKHVEKEPDMSRMLERAFEGVRQLSDEQQNDLAGFLFAHLPEDALTPEDLAETDTEIACGEFIEGDALKEFWRKLGA